MSARERLHHTVVVPTTGRASLHTLLDALRTARSPLVEEILLVDDRPGEPGAEPLAVEPGLPVRVVRSAGVGPAAARNIGWHHARSPWVVFLDDDVVPASDWGRWLEEDLASAPAEVAACQGVLSVPLPGERAPTDLERDTAGLASAWWITADIAYRREVLARLGGFDERFPRAFREDADLALRARARGYRLVAGERRSLHPVRRAGVLASVRAQAGNADNAVMRAKHGRRWRRLAGEGPGRTREHVATTALLLTALAAATRLRDPLWRKVSGAAALGWATATAEFALRRILPGPRTPAEIATMLLTSVLIPPAACWHRSRGQLKALRVSRRWSCPPPRAVLFDRDDTLVHDVPYNGDPRQVRPLPGVSEALRSLRDGGVLVGVVTNQSGVSRGLLDRDQVDSVNTAVENQLGPFATWQVCPHGDGDGCRCRKPEPGLIERAAAELHLLPSECVVIGDTGADLEAASRAGARAILVPTTRTRPEEVRRARAAAEVTRSVTEAVERLLEGAGR
ncbi:HAD-IIIA family hydrolase [Actinopolyspora saharensis]|uniref:HAD-IIIA family hydrolase n=1 Tax=Actinopolyspora saharensis TaxID=995062 RepID=UPI003F66E8FA